MGPDLIQFSFPPMTEDELRRERLRAFWSSAAVALLPYFWAVFWHLSDNFELDAFYFGIPDLALAGLVIAIAAFSNTILSFTRLDGWNGVGRWTFLTSFAVIALAMICVQQYFKAAYAPQNAHKPRLLFYIALASMIGTCIFSYLQQHCFVSDECRAARAKRAKLPQPRTRKTLP
ncbi:hypothetical protein [Bradyrhizobium roseum]|uniref:hypothetical protein n=1 Tax=Bradyrhizobium roseum TaxID=3056648 RepID=UPI00260BF4A2|nr:hypothetical protein [Bradyrhizobium roseus]WKA30227.1 hypothetical protein QUH67_08685 [Bradyrhizobium roseus]